MRAHFAEELARSGCLIKIDEILTFSGSWLALFDTLLSVKGAGYWVGQSPGGNMQLPGGTPIGTPWNPAASVFFATVSHSHPPPSQKSLQCYQEG